MGRIRSARSGIHADVGRIGASVEGILLEIAFLIYTISRFFAKITETLARNIYRMIRQLPLYLLRLVRYLLVPVLVFSLLAFVTILLLRDYRAYVDGVSALETKTLWGEAMTLMILVLVLCGASFGFARSIPGRFVADGIEAAFLGLIVYLVVSVSSIALAIAWVGLKLFGLEFSPAEPGALFVTNILAVVLLMLAIIVVQGVVSIGGSTSAKDHGESDREFPAESRQMGWAELVITLPMIIFAIVSVFYGFAPMRDGLAIALGH
jgi:hypothetical protein